MKKKQRVWALVVVTFVLVLAGAAGGWWYWQNASGVDRFMATDISKANDKDLEQHIRAMNLTNASRDQRRAVADKLLARIRLMSMKEQLSLIDMGRKVLADEPNSQLGRTVKILETEFWSRQSREYMKLTEAERKALIDKRLAQEQALVAARKAKQLANMLMGKPGESESARNARHAGDIVETATSALKSADTSDRAAAAQLYTDIQKRRAELGLPAGL